MRAHNLALVLRTCADSADPISRAAVAAATGLTRATVSALVDDLRRRRPADRGGPATAHRRRPPRRRAGPRPRRRRPGSAWRSTSTTWPPASSTSPAPSGTASCTAPTSDPPEPRPPWPASAGSPPRPGALAEADGLVLAGATLAVPGLVAADGARPGRAPTSAGTTWTLPPCCGRSGPARPRRHRRQRGQPRRPRRDCTPAAARPPASCYVSGEIGIGAGIVLDGALYRGARGWSGEIGHVPVHPDGPPCRCGARGCLEQYAGQEAILRAAGVPDDRVARLAQLADRAAAGDPAAWPPWPGPAPHSAPPSPPWSTCSTSTRSCSAAATRPCCPGCANRSAAEIAPAGARPPTGHRCTLRAATLGADAAMIGAAGAVIRAVHDDPARWLAACR